MQTIRIRLTGKETNAASLINMLHDIAGVEQVEEMPSPGSNDRSAVPMKCPKGDASPCICHIEVAVVNERAADRLRTFTAGAAMLMDASAEFVGRF